MNPQRPRLTLICLAALVTLCVSSLAVHPVCADVIPNRRPHPAVVRVIAVEGRGTSLGSGTLVAVSRYHGLVLTNWHVVRDAKDSILVRFPDGFTSPARVMKVDRDWDLAALAIWRPRVVPVAIATTPPKPGDMLTIAGYGSGNYRAATGRCTQYVAPSMRHPFEMVELSTTARQGDSGGPIFNEQGELAGVLFGSGFRETMGSYCGRVRNFLADLKEPFYQLPPPTMIAGTSGPPGGQAEDTTEATAGVASPRGPIASSWAPLETQPAAGQSVTQSETDSETVLPYEGEVASGQRPGRTGIPHSPDSTEDSRASPQVVATRPASHGVRAESSLDDSSKQDRWPTASIARKPPPSTQSAGSSPWASLPERGTSGKPGPSATREGAGSESVIGFPQTGNGSSKEDPMDADGAPPSGPGYSPAGDAVAESDDTSTYIGPPQRAGGPQEDGHPRSGAPEAAKQGGSAPPVTGTLTGDTTRSTRDELPQRPSSVQSPVNPSSELSTEASGTIATDAADLSKSADDAEDTAAAQSGTTQREVEIRLEDLLGKTTGERIKTILAAIGFFVVVGQVRRLSGGSSQKSSRRRR